MGATNSIGSNPQSVNPPATNFPRELHSTDPRWKPDNHESRLLDFLEDLIIDVARTHPRVRDLDVALWIARVAVGAKK